MPLLSAEEVLSRRYEEGGRSEREGSDHMSATEL